MKQRLTTIEAFGAVVKVLHDAKTAMTAIDVTKATLVAEPSVRRYVAMLHELGLIRPAFRFLRAGYRNKPVVAKRGVPWEWAR